MAVSSEGLSSIGGGRVAGSTVGGHGQATRSARLIAKIERAMIIGRISLFITTYRLGRSPACRGPLSKIIDASTLITRRSDLKQKRYRRRFPFISPMLQSLSSCGIAATQKRNWPTPRQRGRAGCPPRVNS